MAVEQSQHPAGPPDPARFQSRPWIFFACVWLVFSAFPVYYLFREARPLPLYVFGMAGVLFIDLTYLFLPPRLFSAPLRSKATLVAAQFTVVLALVLVFDLGWMGLFCYVLATAALLLPFNAALAMITLSLVASAVVTATQGLGYLWLLVVLPISGVSVLGVTRMIRSSIDQDREQREKAHLAVVEERLRLARDIHDVLGHSLTTITVKAGLARRLLESASGDIPRAAAEVADVERLARQAMAEVRLTVSGYREASLAAELAGARIALTAADIQAELPQAVDDVRPQYQEAFAFVVREGVTNVLRHSGASRCQVRLGPSWLEVSDNGQQSAVDSPKGTVDGNGLTGLRERLTALGGQLEAEALPEGGFRLRAAVPESS